ncbi:DUF1043 domain-containing protein [Aliidiomarina shirensis]|uniref:Z-ring associated protein G n=1 Tax=Aliidiomarina shirensis TaxID=1048642 RepID=A0A432WUW9_9GAMM|nr:DUF1043 family protein [Aliidiomarina shirensis]RUO37565.1 DUF1043 domain-containing protein [Aliidiomarina shirensis]
MDWLIGILLLIAGVIIGFFAARFYASKTGDTADLKSQIENSQQQFEAYRKDVVEQLASARQLASEVTDIQHRLNLFLQDSQHLLEQDKDWQQPLLFSEETIRSIRKANVLNRDRRDDNALADMPPRDYSEPGSGLFTPVPKAVKED